MDSRFVVLFAVVAVVALFPASTYADSCSIVPSSKFTAAQTTTAPGTYQWKVAPCKPQAMCGGTKQYVVQFEESGQCNSAFLQCSNPPKVTKTSGGYTLSYEWCGTSKVNGEKDVTLNIKCGKGPLKLTSSGVSVTSDPNVQNKYMYTFGMEGECSSFDGGWVFVIIVLVGLFLYFVGGFAFNHFVRKLRGVEAIPNVTFWKDLPYLVKDGFMFVFGRFCGRGGFSTVK